MGIGVDILHAAKTPSQTAPRRASSATPPISVSPAVQRSGGSFRGFSPEQAQAERARRLSGGNGGALYVGKSPKSVFATPNTKAGTTPPTVGFKIGADMDMSVMSAPHNGHRLATVRTSRSTSEGVTTLTGFEEKTNVVARGSPGEGLPAAGRGAVQPSPSKGLLRLELESGPASASSGGTHAVEVTGNISPAVLSGLEGALRSANAVEAAEAIIRPVNVAAAASANAAMLDAARERHEVFEDKLVARAFGVAAAAHEGQVRKDGSTVLHHLVETGLILAELGLDSKVVAAGLLHDALDDSALTSATLRRTVGTEVVDLVEGVSRMSHVSQMTRDSARDLSQNEAEALKAMLIAMADARTVIVKMADRLHNLRTLGALTPDKRLRLAQETLAVYVPLASRLGIWSLKARLEDECFRWLQPAAHAALATRLEEGAQRESICDSIEALGEELRRRGIDCVDICGRPKSLFSIHRKMTEKGLGLEDLPQVHDVRAVRVVVRGEASCYDVLDAVNSKWSTVEGKAKDYIRAPKGNGYQSLHSVVIDSSGQPLEVQIRTPEMHHKAEFGMAAHWRYKEESPAGDAAAAAAPMKLSRTESSAAEDLSADSEKGAQKEARAASGGVATHRSVDDQVAWARFMLSWQTELADNKCRLEGSAGDPLELCPCPFPHHRANCPNHEDNNGMGKRGPGMSSGMMGVLCSPIPTECDISNTSPIFVILSVDGRMRVKELPRNSTVASLQLDADADVAADGFTAAGLAPPGMSNADMGLGFGAAHRADLMLGVDTVTEPPSPAARASEFLEIKSIAVNREQVPVGAEGAVRLRMGDLIEVTHERVRFGSSVISEIPAPRPTHLGKHPPSHTSSGVGVGDAGAAAAATAGRGALGKQHPEVDLSPGALERERRRLLSQLDLEVSALRPRGLSSVVFPGGAGIAGLDSPGSQYTVSDFRP